MSTLNDYTNAVSAHKDMWLGTLTWYTITNVHIRYSEMIDLIVKYNLADDKVKLPMPPQNSDVFERVAKLATKSVAMKDDKLNYVVRDLANTDEYIIRRIVRERNTKDETGASGRRLAYKANLMEVRFNKLTYEITSSYLEDGVTDPIAEAICDEIKSQFAHWRGHLNSYATREWIRKCLLSNLATPVKDGIFFIPQKNVEFVNNLTNFISEIPGGSWMHSVPLLDATDQRELVSRCFESASTARALEMMETIEGLADRKYITEDKYNSILETLDDINSKSKEYSEILENALLMNSGSVDVLRIKVLGLADKVKFKK